jgi:hypothetical protein
LFGEFFVFLRISIEPLTFESFAIKLSNEKDEPTQLSRVRLSYLIRKPKNAVNLAVGCILEHSTPG